MACRPFFFPFFLSPFLYFCISIPHDHCYHLKSTFSSSPPTSNTTSTVSPVSGMYNGAYQCDDTTGVPSPSLVWPPVGHLVQASHAHHSGSRTHFRCQLAGSPHCAASIGMWVMFSVSVWGRIIC